MLIFLYGENNFHSTEKLKYLKKEFFSKNTSNAASSVFDFNEENSAEKLKIALKARGLFAQSLLVVVKNTLNADKLLKDDLLNFFVQNYTEFISDEITLILWEKDAPRKNDKFFKWLLEKAEWEEFKNPSNLELKKMVEDRLHAHQIKVENKVIDKILEYARNDLFILNNELEKIINYIGKEGNIGEQEINILINAKLETNIFKTIELLSQGNKKQALRMLHNQLNYGDDPFYILSMYIYQFRNLLKISDFYYKGNNSHYEVAKIIKLHPFVVQKGMQQLQGFTFGQLKDIYSKLEEIDQEAKVGKKSIELALDLLIAEL